MRAVFLGVVLVLGLAGCGGEGASGLDDGRHFGYVQSADASSSPWTAEFDVAEFLSGEEANSAAVEDGVIAEGEPVPNDYYVRNEDKTAVTVDVSPDVRVTHIQCPDACTEGLPGDFAAFAAAFDDPADKTLLDEYRGSQSQYWLTLEDGEVVEIHEQYVP